jgi:hypothetical protein
MIRQTLVVTLTALAFASTSAFGASASNSQPSTPGNSMSDVNSFGTASAVPAQRAAPKYAQAVGSNSDSSKCKNDAGEPVKCAADATGDGSGNGGLVVPVVVGLAAAAGLALYSTSGGGSHPISR